MIISGDIVHKAEFVVLAVAIKHIICFCMAKKSNGHQMSHLQDTPDVAFAGYTISKQIPFNHGKVARCCICRARLLEIERVRGFVHSSGHLVERKSENARQCAIRSR